MVTYDKQMYIVLGQHLKHLRDTKGYSLEYVGDQIGKTKKTISRYENGEHRMETETIMQLSSLYDYDYQTLMNEVQENLNNDVSFDDFRFALYGEVKDLSDDQKQDLLDYVKFIKSKKSHD